RQHAVFHAGVGEEVLVLGRQDGLAQDQGHVLVGDYPAVLARQLDQDLALVIEDLSYCRGLESEESPEIWESAPIEVNVVNSPPQRQKRRKSQQRNGQAGGAAQPRGAQPTGRDAADGVKPFGHHGEGTAQPCCHGCAEVVQACKGSAKPRRWLGSTSVTGDL